MAEINQEDQPITEYQTWQELAYLSVLFARLAHTYRGLEQQVKRDEHLLPPSGEDVGRWWIDFCDPEAPVCVWDVGDFAVCLTKLAGKVREVFGRVNSGIDAADKLMSKSEPLKKNPGKTFEFKNTVLRVPDEEWLESDD